MLLCLILLVLILIMEILIMSVRVPRPHGPRRRPASSLVTAQFAQATTGRRGLVGFDGSEMEGRRMLALGRGGASARTLDG